MFVHIPFVDRIKYPEDARFNLIRKDLFRNFKYSENGSYNDPEYIKLDDECWRIHLARDKAWQATRLEVLCEFKLALQKDYNTHPAIADTIFKEVMDTLRSTEPDLEEFEQKYVKLHQKYTAAINAVLEHDSKVIKSDVID